MKRTAILIIFVYTIILTACSSSMSVIEKDAINSFEKLLTVMPAEEKEGDYQLKAPDHSAEFSFNNSSMWLMVDAAPFVNAGLNAGALACADVIDDNNVRLFFTLPAGDMLNHNIKDTAQEQFRADIKFFREYLAYNNITERYIIRIEDAKVEWTKDINKEAPGLVFVLRAEPLVAAGVDPQKVEGWEYVEVLTEENGKAEKSSQFQKNVRLTN